MAVCHNIPQDLSLKSKDESVDNVKIPDDVSLDAPVHDDGSHNSDYFTGPGTSTHQFRTYSVKIQTLSNRLVQVANVTVRMEEGGTMCKENMEFADLVNDCVIFSEFYL